MQNRIETWYLPNTEVIYIPMSVVELDGDGMSHRTHCPIVDGVHNALSAFCMQHPRGMLTGNRGRPPSSDPDPGWRLSAHNLYDR